MNCVTSLECNFTGQAMHNEIVIDAAAFLHSFFCVLDIIDLML